MADRTPEDLRQKELDIILKFGSLINSSLKIEEVLDYAMQWAEEFMNAEASTIYELDEEKGDLFIRVARGEKKEPIKKIRLQLGEGIAGRVVQTGLPMVVQDVLKEESFSPKFDRKSGFDTKSMICVPLILRGIPIGAFQILNKRSGVPFDSSDVELLTSMSQLVAVALENAKLYRRLEEKFELTERELKITQQELIRSSRLAAMGHLAQGVAHEIRNPVTSIGGFARRIEKALNHESKLKGYVQIILKETERLENLVRQVNEFSSVLFASLVHGDVREVLDLLIENFKSTAQDQRVSLLTAFDQALPYIRMDPSQLLTALSSITENALESMPEGGKLAISARQKGNLLMIEVSDSGCGISGEHIESVYDPFFTSKTRGAGMGLTMVHQIITNHDGEIKIQSLEGKGTTVTIRLPVAA